MQSPRPAATEIPSDLALIKELVATSDYKFVLPAASNKLLSIKLLTIWFESISKMLSRFPDVYVFLFGITASLNKGSELQLRTTQVKLEGKSAKLEEAPSAALPDIFALVKEEVRLFGEIKTFEDFGKFVRATSYKAEAMGNSDLQHFIAPHLFRPVDTAGLRTDMLSSAPERSIAAYESEANFPPLVDSSDSDSDGESKQPEAVAKLACEWPDSDAEKDSPAPIVWRLIKPPPYHLQWCDWEMPEDVDWEISKAAVSLEGLKLAKGVSTNKVNVFTEPLHRPPTQPECTALGESPSVPPTEGSCQ